MERRNPYLMLGIMFGASRDEAQRAYTARLRSARTDGGTGIRQADLEAAMRQIDSGPQPPDTGLTPYRIPADPYALQTDASGVFAPPVEPSPVTNAEVTAALDDLQVAAAVEHIRQLIITHCRNLQPPAP